MQALDLGFAGLRVLGAPMAAHLARARHRLRLHDADVELPQSPARALGAQRGFTGPVNLLTGLYGHGHLYGRGTLDVQALGSARTGQ